MQCRCEETTLSRLDFGGWSEIAESSSEPGGSGSLPPEPAHRAQRGSLGTNLCAAGDWVWLPEQPQAGAHALVAVVSRLLLAKVLHTYTNGAVGVQLFDKEAFSFSSAEMRLPPPRTVLEAEQRATTYIDHVMMMTTMLLRQSLSLMMISVATRYIFSRFIFSRYIVTSGVLLLYEY